MDLLQGGLIDLLIIEHDHHWDMVQNLLEDPNLRNVKQLVLTLEMLDLLDVRKVSTTAFSEKLDILRAFETQGFYKWKGFPCALANGISSLTGKVRPTGVSLIYINHKYITE